MMGGGQQVEQNRSKLKRAIVFPNVKTMFFSCFLMFVCVFFKLYTLGVQKVGLINNRPTFWLEHLKAHVDQLLTQDFCFEHVFVKLSFFQESHSPRRKKKLFL